MSESEIVMQRRPMVDGHTVARASHRSDHLSISRLEPNTLFLLRKYRIEACLLRPDAPLGTFLAALPDWERVYSDEVSGVYVSKRRQVQAATRPLLSRGSAHSVAQVLTSESSGRGSAKGE